MSFGGPPPGGYGGPPPGGYGGPPPGGYGGPPPGGYGGPPPGGYAPPPPAFGPPQWQGAAQQASGDFPQRLADAPRERRIDETFGWFPASLATAAILAILGTLLMAALEGGFDNLDQLKFCGIAILVAGLCAFWEIWRRTRPTSLVVLGERLGVYRKGQLESVIGFGQVTWFRLNIVNSLREYMLFGIFGFGGSIGALGALSAGSAPGALWAAAAGLGGLGGLSSSIWSRGMCNHYYIPKANGGTETVVLRRTQLVAIGWPMTRWG